MDYKVSEDVSVFFFFFLLCMCLLFYICCEVKIKFEIYSWIFKLFVEIYVRFNGLFIYIYWVKLF